MGWRMTKTNAGNKRINPRVNLSKEAKKTKVFVTSLHSDKPIPESLLNLSTGGVALNVRDQLSQNDTYVIHIHNGKKKISVEAKVRWQGESSLKRLKYKAGFAFTAVTQEQAATLGELVQTLLKNSTKQELLKKISEIYMMGYFAESDLQLSSEYFMAKEEEFENTIKRLNEIFEKVPLLVQDEEIAEKLRRLYYQSSQQ